MTIKREDLSPRELQVFDAAVQLANGEEGKTVLLEGITPALKAALPEDFPEKTIGGLIRSLKKKRFFLDGGRGNIKVKCLWPTEESPTDTKGILTETTDPELNAKSTEDGQGGEAKKDKSTAIEANAQVARLAPNPSTSKQLLELLGRINDPKKLADKLLSSLTMDDLTSLHNLVKLMEGLHDNPRCPKFEESEDGLKITMIRK